jgi:hypothetical protein
MMISRRELADLLQITPTKVTNLVDANVLPKSINSKYDLRECIARYIEYAAEALLKIKAPKNAQAQEETLNYWKMVRQKNAALKEMGVTMRVEEAEQLMSIRLEQIRNVLNTIDSVWAPYLVGLKTNEDAQRMLTKQLDVLFEQLSSLQDFALEEEEPNIEDGDDDEI